jgi:hypothetical protein
VGSVAEPPMLSLPHAVGAWLLDEAGWQGPRRYVVPGSQLASLGGEDVWALLVIADGSNTRSAKAPGAFNPEGELFDAAVAAAIGSGDPSTLETLRAPEGIDAQGVPAWRDVARLAAGRTYAANLMATLAPFGVGYLVATWA